MTLNEKNTYKSTKIFCVTISPGAYENNNKKEAIIIRASLLSR